MTCDSSAVIFLDIDGVLNVKVPRGKAQFHGRNAGPVRRALVPTFIPSAIDNLNALLGETGALLVLSSSWRLRGNVLTVLESQRITGPWHSNWRTGNGGGDRGSQIQRWLDSNDHCDYVIFDDWPAGMHIHGSRFVRTNFRTGLTLANIEMARQILARVSLPVTK
jgi:hypothetical protein